VIKYNTRYNYYFPKFLNALFTTISTLSDEGDNLFLNDLEDSELKRDSTEVISIGLSNKFMCNWFGINVNRIEKIPGTGKRCDFRFPFDGDTIIFEAKGRTSRSQINSALTDCIEKKSNYQGNFLYSIIGHLPRNGSPARLLIYDPPIYRNGLNFNEKYLIAKHYCNVAELSGLVILADRIRSRIKYYKRIGNWDTTPLEFSNLEKLEFSNLEKIGISISINNNIYWTRRTFQDYSYRNKNIIFKLVYTKNNKGFKRMGF
jgi:hypothetical protein